MRSKFQLDLGKATISPIIEGTDAKGFPFIHVRRHKASALRCLVMGKEKPCLAYLLSDDVGFMGGLSFKAAVVCPQVYGG